jgi:hypothetical protein
MHSLWKLGWCLPQNSCKARLRATQFRRRLNAWKHRNSLTCSYSRVFQSDEHSPIELFVIDFDSVALESRIEKQQQSCASKAPFGFVSVYKEHKIPPRKTYVTGNVRLCIDAFQVELASAEIFSYPVCMKKATYLELCGDISFLSYL